VFKVLEGESGAAGRETRTPRPTQRAGIPLAYLEEVGEGRAGGWRWAGGESEAIEDRPYGSGILDGGQHAQSASAPRAFQYVQLEHVPHQISPRPVLATRFLDRRALPLAGQGIALEDLHVTGRE
jgi:hypothetical protein